MKILKVSANHYPNLLLSFSDGTELVCDLSPFIRPGLSAALQDPGYFAQVSIDTNGGLAWPNGYDISAHFLREWYVKPPVVPAKKRSANQLSGVTAH